MGNIEKGGWSWRGVGRGGMGRGGREGGHVRGHADTSNKVKIYCILSNVTTSSLSSF